MYLIIVNGIRTSDPHWLNKGCGLKFHIGSWVWQEIPEEGWRTHHCKYNNKDEDYSPKTLNNKDHQASSQKFRPLLFSDVSIFRASPNYEKFKKTKLKQMLNVSCSRVFQICDHNYNYN